MAARLLPAFAILTLLLLRSEASACSCLSSGPPCQALFQSDAVFVGTVKSIGMVTQSEPNQPGHDRRLVTFSVERAVRGIDGGTVAVRTGEGGGDCGFNFQEGRRYIVYAHRHPAGWLSAGICSRTRLLSEAAEDLAFIDAMPTSGSGGRVSGTIKHWENDPAARRTVEYGPVADVQVLVRGSRGTFSGMTDTAGKYSVAGIPVGAYEIEVLPPANFSTRYLQRKIEIKDARACQVVDFGLHFDGRIQGTLVDSTGKTVAGIRIDVVPAARPLELSSVYPPNPISDEAGRFELGDIPPGQYLVGVGLKPQMDAEVAFMPTYYPGTPELSAAKAIEVGPGSKVDLGVLRLPPPLRTHRLTGIVVMPDGTPVHKANVSLFSTSGLRAAIGVSTDEQGQFTVRVHEGLSYSVRAFVNVGVHPAMQQIHATQTISIKGPPGPLRLVLTPR